MENKTKKSIFIKKDISVKKKQEAMLLEWLYDKGVQELKANEVPFFDKNNEYYQTPYYEFLANSFSFLQREFKDYSWAKKIIQDQLLYKDYICFLNGSYISELSNLSLDLQNKLSFHLLDDHPEKKKFIPLIKKTLNQLKDPLAFMVDHFIEEFYIFEVNESIENPIQIFFLFDENQILNLNQAKTIGISNLGFIFSLEEEKKAKFIYQSFVKNKSQRDQSDLLPLINEKKIFLLKKNSQVDFYNLYENNQSLKLNDFNIAYLDKNSKLNYECINFDNIFLRKYILIFLNEKNAEFNFCQANILLKNKKDQAYLFVDLKHCEKETKSYQRIQNILANKSKTMCRSHVFMDKNTEKSFSKQLIHNTLISDDASSVNKPSLEISTDDVKAQHGTTVGSLDEATLFYMQSRGLSLQSSRFILIKSSIKNTFLKMQKERKLWKYITEKIFYLKEFFK